MKSTKTYWNPLAPDNDAAFDLWLEPGYYASRPPGEVHGHFIAYGEAVILEISYLSQRIEK